MTEAQVDLPGAFCAWLDGTSLAQGHDDADLDCKATRLAYEKGVRIQSGRGYRIRVTADATVLRVLVEYAGTCLLANRGDMRNPAEASAAQKVMERASAALAALAAQS